MNKRKMTSIALVAAVAISTVQLAYPADVFAHEQVNNNISIKKEVELSIEITADDMSEDKSGIENAITRKNIENLDAITSLEVTTADEAYLKPVDNEYIKSNFTSLKILDESKCKCSERKVDEAYLKKSGNIEDRLYKEFGGLTEFKSLEVLKMPEETEVINSYSVNKTGIKEINIPNKVLVLESGALSGNINSAGDLIIPDSVKVIGNNAFGMGNNNVECGNLTIGNSVVTIDNNSFAKRLFSGNLVIPNSVEVVGHWAFSPGAFKDGTWTLGNGIKQIGDASFSGICNGNKGTLTISKDWKFVGNGNPAPVASSSFAKNTFEKVVFEEGITETANAVVSGSKNLKEVVLPSTLKKIGRSSLGSTAIEKIKLPEGLEEMSAFALAGNKNLHSVVLPNTLTKLGNQAFEDSDLYGLFIPSATKEIGTRVYNHNNNVVGIDGGIIYVQDDNIETEINELIDNNHWNKKFDSKQTAIANTNGGYFEKDTDFEVGKLSIPKKDGYIFEGWYDNKELKGNKANTIEKEKNNYKSYYANWKKLNDIILVYDGDKDGDNSTNVSTNINLETAKSVRAVDPTVVKIDGNKVTAVGVGVTTIEYLNGNEVIATQNVKVNAPKGTVAMVDKIPYKNLQDAVNSNNNTKIKVVADVVLNTSLDLSKMKSRTIDFGNHKITKSATFPEKETSLIKIEGNNEKITISNAKFDTSNKNELDAIRVVGDKINHPNIVVENIEVNNAGNNKGSAIYVENASVEIRGDASVTGNTSNHTVVEIQGKDSLVVLDENSTINKYKTPDIGNNHSDDVIMGNKTDSNDFINGNNTGGGSVPSIPSTPSKPSKPVYTHKEVIGANRYETAAKVADELGSYDNVVLVNATSTMSDGLAASGLAGKENGAILLTKKDSIPKATMDRIKKVKKVYIIGGENAISQKVANQITAANIKVERIGGKNRVETSELVAEKLGNYSNAFIVNGFKGEADAMSASAIAARYEAPILLTNGKTSTHAKKSGVEYYVVGGTSVVNKSIADKYNAERLAGKDRYATNREVIDEFYSGSDKLYLANGETLVDALTASTIAKNHGIVLVNKKSDNSVLKDKNTVQIGGMNFNIDFDK